MRARYVKAYFPSHNAVLVRKGLALPPGQVWDGWALDTSMVFDRLLMEEEWALPIRQFFRRILPPKDAFTGQNHCISTGWLQIVNAQWNRVASQAVAGSGENFPQERGKKLCLAAAEVSVEDPCGMKMFTIEVTDLGTHMTIGDKERARIVRRHQGFPFGYILPKTSPLC